MWIFQSHPLLLSQKFESILSSRILNAGPAYLSLLDLITLNILSERYMQSGAVAQRHTDSHAGVLGSIPGRVPTQHREL